MSIGRMFLVDFVGAVDMCGHSGRWVQTS
ncbi:hypothetical protein M3J09_012289 [Ascochyta lentis]